MKNELNEFLGSHRKQFQLGELNEEIVPKDPFLLLNAWLNDAIKNNMNEPFAMSLATAVHNKPTQRIVYARELLDNGLVFFTNYLSRKGQELQENNHASVLFFWTEAERQVRMEGIVEIATDKISNDYFASRPRNSQLGSWASEQSKKINSRKELEDRMIMYDHQFKNNVPRPEHWGGYVFYPSYYEFWQGRPNRLHDRICYKKVKESWDVFRIAP